MVMNEIIFLSNFIDFLTWKVIPLFHLHDLIFVGSTLSALLFKDYAFGFG